MLHWPSAGDAIDTEIFMQSCNCDLYGRRMRVLRQMGVHLVYQPTTNIQRHVTSVLGQHRGRLAAESGRAPRAIRGPGARDFSPSGASIRSRENWRDPECTCYWRDATMVVLGVPRFATQGSTCWMYPGPANWSPPLQDSPVSLSSPGCPVLLPPPTGSVC